MQIYKCDQSDWANQYDLDRWHRACNRWLSMFMFVMWFVVWYHVTDSWGEMLFKSFVIPSVTAGAVTIGLFALAIMLDLACRMIPDVSRWLKGYEE